ncbi:MAG: FAD/NAD(P)-binding oxidoreductase [Rhodocyclaceae bacterium]|nr:FAD/NAD(P)-binding oxidoreductase [Rhodocyclaceae bacterium]
MGRTVIVLGAGLGGLVAAETLRKLLPSTDRVIAVDREDQHYFPPSLLWLMVGLRQPKDFTRPLHRLAGRGVELIHGHITRIDPERREVVVNGQTVTADALVIALGAEYAPEVVPGLSEAGLDFYTMSGAQAAYAALSNFQGGRIVFLTAAPIYKCPAAPYEAALLVEAFLQKRGVRARTTLDFFAAEPQPMPVIGQAGGAAVREMIETRHITYHPAHQVKEVDTANRRISFANGVMADYDLLLYVSPHRAPMVAREAGLTNEAGWIPVDRHTMQTEFEGVFALGDITTIPLKMGKPLPKAGVFAHGQAETVAHNIAHAWTGEGKSRHYHGKGMCFIEAGFGRAGIGKGNFYADPLPDVDLRRPTLLWHWGKLLYEKYWLYRRF